MEPQNKGHCGTNDIVPCRDVVPISEVNTKVGLKQVSFVEKLSLSRRSNNKLKY